MQQVIQYSLFDRAIDCDRYKNLDYITGGKLKFIDLFAGIGGIRIAFEKIEARCVFSSEWDKYARQTYEANFQEMPYGDITKIDIDSMPNFDILCGGFPCQPFSSIGKREGFAHQTQGTLFYEIVKILDNKKPISFLLENVEGIVNHNKGETLKVILESLYDLNNLNHEYISC